MRTHGHREGNITHLGLSGAGGDGKGIALGEISNVDDKLTGAANHHGTCIPINKPACSAHVSQNLKLVEKNMSFLKSNYGLCIKWVLFNSV